MTTLAVARSRIEIHPGPPKFFDDHFEKNWAISSGGTSSFSTDGDVATLNSGNQTNGLALNDDIGSIVSNTYTKLAVRVKSVTNAKAWGVDLYYDAGWHNLLTGQTGTGLVEASLPSGKTVTKIILRAEGLACTVTFDYVSFNKAAVVVPLNPPVTQDVEGVISVTSRMNKLSTASFVINNTPSTFGGTGPYNGKIFSKDVVIIWAYRSGDTLDETMKLFGGIVVNPGYKAEKTTSHFISVECIDHGWELQKPPSLLKTEYVATLGKTILTDAANKCAYLSGALIDVDGDIASLHDIDYSPDGNEVTPSQVLEDLAPRCATGGSVYGFDWHITPAGIIELYQRDSVSSGLTLNDDDLESFTRDEDWYRTYNSITIYGKANDGLWTADVPTEMGSPSVMDYVASACSAGQKNLAVVSVVGFSPDDVVHISLSPTYETAVIDYVDPFGQVLVMKTNLANAHDVPDGVWKVPGWLVDGDLGEPAADSTNKTTGNRSVRAVKTASGLCYLKYDLGDTDFLDMNQCPIIMFDILLSDTKTVLFTVYDDQQRAGNYQLESIASGSFVTKEIKGGKHNLDGWNVSSGVDWTRIQTLQWAVVDSTINIDNLISTGKRFAATATNSTSIGVYGTMCRAPEVDETLNANGECSAKAEGLLLLYGTSIKSWSNVKLQSGQKVDTCETIIVASTTPNLSDTLRVIEVDHKLSGTDWDTILKLDNEPSSMSYLFYLNAQKIQGVTRISIGRD